MRETERQRGVVFKRIKGPLDSDIELCVRQCLYIPGLLEMHCAAVQNLDDRQLQETNKTTLAGTLLLDTLLVSLSDSFVFQPCPEPNRTISVFVIHV